MSSPISNFSRKPVFYDSLSLMLKTRLSALFPCLLAGTALLASAGIARGIENHDLCAAAAFEAEKLLRIPAYLLQAIAVTESGRWDKRDQKRKPWPWAVGAQKKSHYFSTKKEAVEFVANLQKQDISNIDVGCMQINLHYHGETFQSLDEVFNPINNVAYGGIFLAELYTMKSSWNQAVKYYHSANPKYNRRYIKAVFESWEKLKEQADNTNNPLQSGIVTTSEKTARIQDEQDNQLLPEASVNREIQTILQPENIKKEQENTLLKNAIRYDAFARVKAAQRLNREYLTPLEAVPPPVIPPDNLLKAMDE